LPGLVVTGIGVAIVASTMPAATGCTTHQCDPDCVWVNPPAALPPAKFGCSEGSAPSANLFHVSDDEMVWESSPLDGATWCYYPGLRSYTFFFPPEMADALTCGGWVLEAPIIWVSTQADNQTFDGATAAPAAGELAQVTQVSTTAFTVTNGSCARYYIRVEVHAVRPANVAAGGCDAGVGEATDPNENADAGGCEADVGGCDSGS
jgi:hypothetical protein